MESRVGREEWRERVRAWQASGLTCTQFARRAGVHPGTLSWWRWKLASEGEDRRGARRGRAGAERPLGFVEIASQVASVLVSGESRIELEVGRVTLRLPDQFSSDTLARILAVLEAGS